MIKIKEILDYMKEESNYKHLSFNTAKVLLDYITNLQEENERYKKIFEGKERFSKIMPDDMDFIVMSKTDYDRQVDDIELVALELRSRIDKAIEYIKEDIYVEPKELYGLIDGEHLLNILQGENKELEKKYEKQDN